MRLLSWLLFLHLLLSLSPKQAQAWLNAPTDVFDSTFDLGGTGLFLLGSGLTAWQQPEDRNFREANDNDRDPVDRELLNIAESFGTGVPTASIILLQLLFDPIAGWAHMEGALYSQFTVDIIKLISNRRRPNGRKYSFPSGHTALAFATATNLLYFYPWYVGLPAYGFASFVAYQRVVDNRHWLSDTIAGATVGIIFARGAARLQDGSAGQVSVTPLPQGLALNWSYRF